MRLSMIGGRIPDVVRLTCIGRSHELMKSGGIASGQLKWPLRLRTRSPALNEGVESGNA